MEDEIEAVVGKARKISHVSLDALQREVIAIADETVFGKLLIRQVETDHVRTRRSQDRSLLTASRSKAEDALSPDLSKPTTRHPKLGRQDDLPCASSCSSYRFRIDGSCLNTTLDTPQIQC